MRRKRKQTGPEQDATVPDGAAQEVPEAADEAAPPPASGPVDIEDIDPDTVYIDLGSLLLPATSELELRLQVDEDSGAVLAVLLVAEEGVLEVRAFASSRNGDLWTDARREIAADTIRRGGGAEERDGEFGPELYCEVPVTGPDGEQLVQPSRILGFTGPRWFVRATMAGRPAQDAAYARAFEDVVRTLAVRRGQDAMAPGEALTLKLPPEARPLAPTDD